MRDVRALLLVTAKTLAILFATYIGTEAIRSYLSHNATFAALLPAIVSEWVAGRMGVAWSDPRAEQPNFRTIAGRAGRGIGLALLAAAVVVAVLVSAFGARFGRVPLAVGELVVSVVVSTFIAMRHELIAHGMLLRALGPVSSTGVRVLCCGLLSYAFVVGTGTAPRDALALMPLGACTGLLWMRDRGAFAPVAFHAVWAFVWSSVLHGSVTDLRVAQETAWSGRVSLGHGGVAIFALTLMAFVIARFGRRIFANATLLENARIERVD